MSRQGSNRAEDIARGLGRRDWLKCAAGGVSGAIGLGALGLNCLSAETIAPSASARAKSVIVVFNSGAPSHIDLWDPKPNAASNIRGTFRPIDTTVPGLQVTELLPKIAQHADKLAVVRTLHHSHGGHNSGMHWSIVGRPYRIDSTLINPSPTDYPSFGTLIGWLAQRSGYSLPLPPYVITPYPHCDSMLYITPGQYGGCLGSRYNPFVLNADPNAKNFAVRDMGTVDGVPAERVAQRRALWSQLESQGPALAARAAADLAVNHAKAFDLMTSASGSQAFDLTREPDTVRDRYGRHAWGQSHLLARRLVEAGVRIVTTVNGPSITWDTHKQNDTSLKNRLVPPMEQAYVALLEDLSERGLLDSTLVIWMSDFGRTPIINVDAGRDHWPQCYSMVLAGGGIRGGQVVGESDKTGGYPLARAVTPADIHATIFAALGYDPHAISYLTTDGRPTPLSEGTVVRELLA
jgi:hypothetical protein